MKNSIGMIVVAVLVSAGLVGGATLLRAHAAPQSSGPVVITTPPPTLPTTDWEKDFVSVGPGGTGSTSPYAPPPGISPTDALGREIFSGFASSYTGGAFNAKKAAAAAADIAAHQVAATPPTKVYTLANVVLQKPAVGRDYENALKATMLQANAVREYELSTFSRAVHNNDTADLARLRADAAVYSALAEALIKVPVPQSLAEEHVAAVNAIAEIAAADDALGNWTGDPLDALRLVNSFVAAEGSVTDTLQTLYASVATLEKRT